MTKNQVDLIARLKAQKSWAIDKAEFIGSFLNCTMNVKGSNGKSKPQKFSFRFDDAEACYGANIVKTSFRGTYSEHAAAAAFETIVAFSQVAGQQVVLA